VDARSCPCQKYDPNLTRPSGDPFHEGDGGNYIARVFLRAIPPMAVPTIVPVLEDEMAFELSRIDTSILSGRSPALDGSMCRSPPNILAAVQFGGHGHDELTIAHASAVRRGSRTTVDVLVCRG
jgi:hypothetical protein